MSWDNASCVNELCKVVHGFFLDECVFKTNKVRKM